MGNEDADAMAFLNRQRLSAIIRVAVDSAGQLAVLVDDGESHAENLSSTC